jgi:hypothetical protein
MAVREQETIKKALQEAGADRFIVAKKLGVNRSTVDRWAATGHIASRHWEKLVELSMQTRVERTLAEIPTEALRDELIRRGYVVNLTGRDAT